VEQFESLSSPAVASWSLLAVVSDWRRSNSAATANARCSPVLSGDTAHSHNNFTTEFSWSLLPPKTLVYRVSKEFEESILSKRWRSSASKAAKTRFVIVPERLHILTWYKRQHLHLRMYHLDAYNKKITERNLTGFSLIDRVFFSVGFGKNHCPPRKGADSIEEVTRVGEFFSRAFGAAP
jgi:hypothetical protein